MKDFVPTGMNIKEQNSEKSYWSKLIKHRSVELPDGSVVALRAFFGKPPSRRLRQEIIVSRLDFLRSHPGPNPDQLAAEYTRNLPEAEGLQDRNDPKYLEKISKWFEREMKNKSANKSGSASI